MLDLFIFFFFNDTATTEIYTLSLHDALPILLNFFPCFSNATRSIGWRKPIQRAACVSWLIKSYRDRKSTRLNSSHSQISYAVFCLKKKNRKIHHKSTPYTRTTSAANHLRSSS